MTVCEMFYMTFTNLSKFIPKTFKRKTYPPSFSPSAQLRFTTDYD